MEPPALLSVYLLRRPQCSPTVIRRQRTDDRSQNSQALARCEESILIYCPIIHLLKYVERIVQGEEATDVVSICLLSSEICPLSSVLCLL